MDFRVALTSEAKVEVRRTGFVGLLAKVWDYGCARHSVG